MQRGLFGPLLLAMVMVLGGIGSTTAWADDGNCVDCGEAKGLRHWLGGCKECNGSGKGFRHYISGCPTCFGNHYRTNSCVYGYVDYVYGRGATPDLGGAALQPGFRGYGLLGTNGYGLGMHPWSKLDEQGEGVARSRIKYPVKLP
ncbi:MAG: hypothetical protein U0800_05170 [Isosphaeraceae bacterium]